MIECDYKAVGRSIAVDARAEETRPCEAPDAATADFALTQSPSTANKHVAAETRRTTIWPRNAMGFLAASALLHIGAFIVLAQPWFRPALWELRIPSGHNSPALAASVSSPPSEATTTIRIPPTEVEAVDEEPDRRPADLPDQIALAQFASAKIDERVPPPLEDVRRAASDTPTPSERPKPERQKRTAEVRLPLRETALPMESVASNPALESSGATNSRPPEIVFQIKPVYPATALAAGQEGVVKLRVRVNERGQVVEASIFRSSGFPLLDQAALGAIYRWRFSPVGEATAAEFIHPIRFRLER